MVFFDVFRQNARLDSLDTRLEKLERRLETADLDWDDLYTKMRKLYGRMVKQAQRDGETPQVVADPNAVHDPAELLRNRYAVLRR